MNIIMQKVFCCGHSCMYGPFTLLKTRDNQLHQVTVHFLSPGWAWSLFPPARLSVLPFFFSQTQLRSIQHTVSTQIFCCCCCCMTSAGSWRPKCCIFCSSSSPSSSPLYSPRLIPPLYSLSSLFSTPLRSLFLSSSQGRCNRSLGPQGGGRGPQRMLITYKKGHETPLIFSDGLKSSQCYVCTMLFILFPSKIEHNHKKKEKKELVYWPLCHQPLDSQDAPLVFSLLLSSTGARAIGAFASTLVLLRVKFFL